LKKTYEEYIIEMKKLSGGEGDHIDADNLLCEFLEDLGYTELVKAFEKIGKWYA